MTKARWVGVCVALTCCAGSLAQDVDGLIEDLRDDGVRWNAIEAMRALERLPDPPTDELHDALDSDDWQQRQLASTLLWRFMRGNRWWRNAGR